MSISIGMIQCPLPALSPNFAAGQQVPKDDKRLKTEFFDYPSPAGSGSLKGYLVRPVSAGATRLPAILVIHENRGLNPHIEDIAAPANAAMVKAPLLIQQAEVDERINASWPVYEAALKAAGVNYTAHRYPGTQHGFNSDTTPRYDEAAAQLAWQRTVSFFKTNL